MSVSRLQWIVSACVLDLLAVSDSQAAWLNRRIHTGVPGSSLTDLHGVGGSPELVATTVENCQITITWRNGSQSTTSLTPPVTWQDLGASGTYTESSGSGTRFFRAKQ